MDKSFGSSISESPNEAALNAEEMMTEFFGPKSEDFIQEVKEKSIYRELKSWKLVHLMIKTGDDIKQGTYTFMQNSLQCS